MSRIIASAVLLLLVHEYGYYHVHCKECVQKLCQCSGGEIVCQLTTQHRLGTLLPIWTDASDSSSSLDIKNQSQLKTLQSDGLEHFTGLRKLILNKSVSLITFEEDWIRGVDTTLTELRVINAPKLRTLFPQFLTNITRLKVLEISGTQLERVDFLHGTEGTDLTTLILKNNEIRSFIPGTFLGFENLEELDLRSNELITLEKCAFEHIISKSLARFYLGDNEWLCTCPLLWIGLDELQKGHGFKLNPEEEKEPACAKPDIRKSQVLLDLTIGDCIIAHAVWGSRNCTKYQEEAALYVTTTESLIKGETPEANLFIVYVLIMSGLAIVLITMLICCVTYHKLKGEMIEAMIEQPEEQGWWNDESGKGLKFGEGGGGDGGGLPDTVSKTKNPFRRFLVPFVRRNFANANPKTTTTKRPTKAKSILAKQRRASQQGKLGKTFKRKEMSGVSEQLAKMTSRVSP